MEDLLGLTNPAPLSLPALAVNLVLSIALALALAWFYVRYGRSFSNRERFAHTLPLLSMTTVLIISVVKSSLALSLGLVGALSIVRFRTAIKEPEELVYLFMAISIGLGMGADQRLPTLLALFIMLSFLFLRSLVLDRAPRSNLYLNVVAPREGNTFGQMKEVLLAHVNSADLRRLDNSDATLQATYFIRCPDDETLVALMDDLSARVPGSSCTFIEHDNVLGG
jgi:uncharacterized membrane protein YhiD involved in acid resistance